MTSPELLPPIDFDELWTLWVFYLDAKFMTYKDWDKAFRKIGIKMTPPNPGEFIKDEILAELKLSVSKAAQVLGVRRATLSDLVNGKASLSAEMALRLEKAFGLNAEMMLRMQAWYDVRKLKNEL